MNPRIEWTDRSAQRIDRQRRGDIGRARQAGDARQRQRGNSRRHLRAVDERQSFFRAERDPAEPVFAQRLGGGPRLPPVPHLAFADEDERDVGQRRQVAAGANRFHGLARADARRD